MKGKKWIFSILFRISALLGVLGIVCLLICEPYSAEFSVSVLVVILNAVMAAVSGVVIQRLKED